MVRLRNLQFGYSRKKILFRGLDLSLKPGKTVLLGPNGAGKSTLMRILATSLRTRPGVLSLENLDPHAHRGALREYRGRVAWVPQDVQDIPGLDLHRYVSYFGWLKGLSRTEAGQRAHTALEQVKLTEKAGEPLSRLSGGQLRRVGIATGLVHDAEVLLLDEPTAGLDPAQRSNLRQVLTALPPEKTVLVSTHQTEDLTGLYDEVVVLLDGRIRFQGTVPDFLSLAPGPGSDVERAEQAYMELVRHV